MTWTLARLPTIKFKQVSLDYLPEMYYLLHIQSQSQHLLRSHPTLASHSALTSQVTLDYPL